jgi:hypothetical protein
MPGLPDPASRHVRFLTVARLALRPRPFEPCFMPVAPLGLHPSERFPLEEPYTFRCQMPSWRYLSNSRAAVLRKRCQCPSALPRWLAPFWHPRPRGSEWLAPTMWQSARFLLLCTPRSRLERRVRRAAPCAGTPRRVCPRSSTGQQEVGPRPSEPRAPSQGLRRALDKRGFAWFGRQKTPIPARPSAALPEEIGSRARRSRTRCEGRPAEAGVPPGIAGGNEPCCLARRPGSGRTQTGGGVSRQTANTNLRGGSPRAPSGVGGPVAEATRSGGDPVHPKSRNTGLRGSTWPLPKEEGARRSIPR